MTTEQQIENINNEELNAVAFAGIVLEIEDVPDSEMPNSKSTLRDLEIKKGVRAAMDKLKVNQRFTMNKDQISMNKLKVLVKEYQKELNGVEETKNVLFKLVLVGDQKKPSAIQVYRIE